MATTTMNGGGGGAWSYAVPLEESDGNARAPKSRSSQRPPHDWDDGENAGKTLERRSSAWDLQSDSETAKQRRTSVRANNSTAVRKRSRNALRENKAAPSSAAAPKAKGAGASDPTEDDSAWIHRDKLAQIEIQEMAEAGIYIRPSRRSQSLGPGRENGRTSRSASRSGSRKPVNDQLSGIGYDEDYAAAYPAYEDHDRALMERVASPHEEGPSQRSPQRAGPHSDPRDSGFQPTNDLPFDRSSNHNHPPLTQQPQQQHMGRPGTSRIPVSRISPVPVPHDVVERDSPLPRSRAGSHSLSGSWDEVQHARKVRSASVSSQLLLEADHEGKRTTPPGSSNKHSSSEGSPSKTRVPKQNPNGRKASGPSNPTARPGSSAGKRVTSGSATKRPGSSSGHKSRPSTGLFTPEGEAPWIATMYKPDPRLPPDQQMLPTHAKRMMQEQWEKEGKTGTVYDRDFNLLNDEELRPKPPALSLQSKNLDNPASLPSPSKGLSPNGFSPNESTAGNGWPLSPRHDSGSARPCTSGGYKITPTIPSTPTIQRSSAPSPGPQQPMNHPRDSMPRMPELDEKAEAAPQKGCCCVVM